jgi:hypothetical protein
MLLFYNKGKLFDYHVTIAYINSNQQIPIEAYERLKLFLN